MEPRVCGWWLLVTIAAALALHAPAAVAGGTMTPLAAGAPPYFGNPAGPAFAGDGIVWATQRLGGGGFDVTLDRGGSLETEDVPTTARTKRLTNTLDAEIAASSTHTALAVAIDRCTDASGCKYGDYETVEADVFAGPLAQPLTLRGCAGGVTEAGGGFESMDMSASVLAYLDGCAGGAVVRDLAAGAGASWQVFPAKDQVRIAGPYLAVDSFDPGQIPADEPPQRVTVYDWRSGQVVYGVDGGAPFDVQPDRTLAFETTGASPQIAWASPAEPSPHPLASARAFDVRIANGRVAIRTGSQFEVFDLSGSELAATPAADAAGSFDFDGTQLVYASQPCKVAAIVTWDLGAPPPASASGSCPYARASTAVDDLRHRRLAVPVRCPGIPALGCSGIWAVVLYDPYFHDLGGRLEALDPGQTATLRVRLSRRDACLLEKHRVRRATIDLSPDGLRRPTGRYRPPLLPLTTRGRARACR